MEYQTICQDLIAAQKDGHIRRHRQLSTYREITHTIDEFLKRVTNQSNHLISTDYKSIKTETDEISPGFLLKTIKIVVGINDTVIEFDALITIPADEIDTPYLTFENEDVIHYTKNDANEQLFNMIINKMKLGLKFA
ncbi:MAG: hypothetical protein ACYDD9_07805 [Acidithiobacillus sp.]|uniref:hypothetical protein n=1 Tax=Acidithiobacillus ferrooxidans TaxID=920 RepID=UPI00214AFDF6|nr:hypothetical protein [Acidithiobacillus ferrooxidans]MCR2830472.1 hypothetical protein [Acidithiobacillus ferrooxidans]